MPTSLFDRDEVVLLMSGGAQVVEVLPADEYDAIHIAGAVNLPLRELDERAEEVLDHGRAVIVYCHDFL